MEILINGNKKQSLIFGCFDCECIFIANANEYTYNPYVRRSYCDCPECGAKCKGTEISCCFCKYTKQCVHKSVYDEEICDSFEVDKYKLWSYLGYRSYHFEEE